MGLKVCLAGSGGGHVRQLLDLKPVWDSHDFFFVTEPTVLGSSLSLDYPVEFIPHYSFGQIRLGNPLKALVGCWRNARASLRAIRRHRPDVIITTGAGAMFLLSVFGKLMGAELIAIESFARFDKPSLFGRLLKPFADVQIIQSPALQEAFPKAHVFDPFKVMDGARPVKQPLIFATVGATLAFPRLVEAIVELKRTGKVTERVVVQTGVGGQVAGDDPPDLTQVETLPFAEVEVLLKSAEVVITHGGTGSLITALREGCHVIAMPRRFSLKEHYDDHQSQIVSAFGQRGVLQEAFDAPSLKECLAQTQHRRPAMATSDPSELISWLLEHLKKLAVAKRS